MNQDQVKTLLLKIRDDVEHFEVIFSGKSSKRVDGLYKPEEREIIIHNRNMSTDREILYTAIHEFAHHIQFTRNPARIHGRVHSQEFWGIFHQLLTVAEERGIYVNPYETEPAFIDLTREIQEKYLKVNGEVMKRFGALLVQAADLCRRHQVSFEDYIERVLGLQRSTAKTLMRISQEDIPTEIGYDNMKTLASIHDQAKRAEVFSAMQAGKSPPMIKRELLGGPAAGDPAAEDPQAYLSKERTRIQKRITALQQKLEQIDRKLTQYE